MSADGTTIVVDGVIEFTDQRLTIRSPAGNDAASRLALMLHGLLIDAAYNGLVITVEQQCVQPLAMGNHRTVATVRRKGKAYYP